ncbi:MAG: YebC/PmpR family DNA-binding transcriptional regulator [Candidatus Buchananbacteria bacterium]|nr:YebC/PmpR family DNA-binding transcriptional regulator [Candidatus Buchananbacteria bacterium]
MSGHSKWATTHRQKSAADAKRSASFTKLANAITIAARNGADLDANFTLRLAIDKAREANMPKDNIERAVKRGSGATDGNAQLESVVYEAFGPNQVALIIEAITDNKNRTVSEVKNTLTKNGGQLAGPNSVRWMFELLGVITITAKLDEALELHLIDAGARDMIQRDDVTVVYCESTDLQVVRQAIQTAGHTINEASLAYIPKELVSLSELDQERLEKLFAALETLDEVSEIYTNAG